METGTVKFFNEERGFGFIKPDDGEKDLFVHKTDTKSPIRENDRVQFEVEHGEKGPYASNVEMIDS